MEKDSSKISEGREIRQSSALTYFHGSISLTEMRIKVRIVEQLQHIFRGIALRGGDLSGLDMSEEARTIRIPYSAVDSSGTNYTAVRKAAENLIHQSFTYQDDQYEWCLVNMIERIGKKRQRGILEIVITPTFLKCLAMQYCWQTFYNVDAIMRLQSPYSMRFYEMMSRQDRSGHSWNFTFSELKSMFGLKGERQVTRSRTVAFDKYKDVKDFIRWVVRPAKEELDGCCPYTFDFIVDRSGEDPVIRFTSIHQSQFDTRVGNELRLNRKISIRRSLPEAARVILMDDQGYAFTEQEVLNNISLFLHFPKASRRALASVLIELLPKAKSKDNPKGWLIGALRGIINDSE